LRQIFREKNAGKEPGCKYFGQAYRPFRRAMQGFFDINPPKKSSNFFMESRGKKNMRKGLTYSVNPLMQ